MNTCRGMRRLARFLPCLSKKRPRIVFIDFLVIKIHRKGEWKTKVHAKSLRRKGMNRYLLVDSKTSEIIDIIADSLSKDAITTGLEFLERLPFSVITVLFDDAYDGKRSRKKAYLANVEVAIAPPNDGKISEDYTLREQDEVIKMIATLGGDKQARKIWGKLVEYNHRVKVESTFLKLKRLIAESLLSRNKRSKKAEVWLTAIINNLWLNGLEGFFNTIKKRGFLQKML